MNIIDVILKFEIIYRTRPLILFKKVLIIPRIYFKISRPKFFHNHHTTPIETHSYMLSFLQLYTCLDRRKTPKTFILYFLHKFDTIPRIYASIKSDINFCIENLRVKSSYGTWRSSSWDDAFIYVSNLWIYYISSFT